jgi:hypothetical protein
MYSVYALTEPNTKDIRYVGYTGSHPKGRFAEHMCLKVPSTVDWLWELMEDRKEPGLLVLDSAISDKSQALLLEGAWRRCWRDLGHDVFHRRPQTISRPSKTWTTYALTWPFKGDVAYVGCTGELYPKLRYAAHVWGDSEVPQVMAWAKELRNYGLLPGFVVLDRDIPNISKARKLEDLWIAHFESTGKSLLNIGMSEEVKAKISVSVKRLGVERPELMEAHSVCMTEKWRDPVYVERVLAARKNSEVFQATRGRKKVSEEELERRNLEQQEHKEAQRLAVEAYRALTAEQKAKITLREKRRLACLARWSKPGARARMSAKTKGRPRPKKFGETNPNGKLTNAQAAEIRLRLQQGETQKVLAEEFGISQSSVSNIKHRVTYSE